MENLFKKTNGLLNQVFRIESNYIIVPKPIVFNSKPQDQEYENKEINKQVENKNEYTGGRDPEAYLKLDSK